MRRSEFITATRVNMLFEDLRLVLSVGVSILEPDLASEARQMRIRHQECRSMHERDLMKARPLYAQSIFVTLRTV